MRKTKDRFGLTSQVFFAMILGAVFGLAIGEPMMKLGFIGEIWLNLIRMIVVPMILVTIITGITDQEDPRSLGKISLRIMAYYIVSTIFATIIGISVALIIKPGSSANLTGLESHEITGNTNITVAEFFENMFSSNMFETFASGNILQTFIIALLIGLAIIRMKDEDSKEKVISAFKALNEIVFSLIDMIMSISPIGIFFLMSSSFAKYGFEIFTSMASLAASFYLALFVHILVFFGSVLWLSAGISPIRFIIDSAELWIYTISTCSSVASIPVNMRVAKEKFDVPERISSFTIPLGSQMNYDGSVILYGTVIVFISQVMNTPLTFASMVKVVILSTIFSTGGGGIPGSGIVKLLVVVEAFGLPTEIVGIIAAFYRIFDMGTTTDNCLGDLTGTIFVHSLEKKGI